jgi:hypothetical protein
VVGVTFANLLDAVLIATGATTSFQLFDFVKVRRVTIRTCNSDTTTGTAYGEESTVAIEYPGLVLGSNGGGKQITNSNVGTAFPAYASLRPDKLCAAAMWQPSSNNTAFLVRAANANATIAVGTLIDVEVSYKNSAYVSPVAISSAIAGATAGNIYFGGLDGGRLAATWARSVFSQRI